MRTSAPPASPEGRDILNENETLWRILAEGTFTAGTGFVLMYAVTGSQTHLPDAEAAYAAIAPGRDDGGPGDIYTVHEIRQVDRPEADDRYENFAVYAHDQRAKRLIPFATLASPLWPDGVRDGGGALWKVVVEESSGDGGGQQTFYAVTDDQTRLPDPNAAYQQLDPKPGSIYMVKLVELVLSVEGEASPQEQWYKSSGYLNAHDQRTRRLVPLAAFE